MTFCKFGNAIIRTATILAHAWAQIHFVTPYLARHAFSKTLVNNKRIFNSGPDGFWVHVCYSPYIRMSELLSHTAPPESYFSILITSDRNDFSRTKTY